jgi:hypothetical protein
MGLITQKVVPVEQDLILRMKVMAVVVAMDRMYIMKTMTMIILRLVALVAAFQLFHHLQAVPARQGSGETMPLVIAIFISFNNER